jgi:hypothetical protein
MGRRAVLTAATAALLAGPTALAFFSGGYFAGPRAWAGVGAWACAAVALLAGARLPRDGAALLAIGALALLAAWSLLSILWAPIAGDAYAAGQIVVLYVGALVAATLLLRGRVAALAEPALAAGVLIVIGYGLSNRLVPGVLHFARSANAEGRLEQPLTYWNTMGELAAIGLVLCARLAGDGRRPRWMRAAAAAAAAPLGLGLYIAFSRGALFACFAGLVTLVVVAPCREQLRAAVLCVLAAAVAAAVDSRLHGVASLQGTLGRRETQGVVALVALVIVMVLAAGAQLRMLARERPGGLALRRHAGWAALAVICAGLALAIVVGAHESSGNAQLSGGASRLTTLESNRYDYWDVALRAFAREPLHGVGGGGWSVYWLRWRTVAEFATDAHSLPLQVLAELGVIGLALLAAFLAGVAVAAARALRTAAAAAAGPIAAVTTYIAHAPLDWDWQMPALTLVAIVLAGTLLAALGSAER